MSPSYPSDLSLDEFELIKAFCPEAKSGGRPRTTELWSVLNAIFYLVVEGCRSRFCSFYPIKNVATILN